MMSQSSFRLDLQSNLFCLSHCLIAINQTFSISQNTTTIDHSHYHYLPLISSPLSRDLRDPQSLPNKGDSAEVVTHKYVMSPSVLHCKPESSLMVLCFHFSHFIL